MDAGSPGLRRPEPRRLAAPLAILGPLANVRFKTFPGLQRHTRMPYPEMDEGDPTLKW